MNNQRWNIAQTSERKFWSKFSNETLMEGFDTPYKERAKYFMNGIKNLKTLNNKTKILQVGGASLDVINYICVGDKYAIDPLADYFKEKFRLNYEKKNIKFVKGIGEELPYEDRTFDIVLLANVIDHVQSPKKVLSETRRVLKDDGIIYLEINTMTAGFKAIAKAYSWIVKMFGKIFNINHPYMFTISGMKRLLEKSNFEIIKEEIGIDFYEGYNNIEEFKLAKKNSLKFKIRLLAKLDMYGELMFLCFCKKIIKN